MNSLKNNTRLFYLDLKDNLLDDEFANGLIDLLSENYFIEDLVISGNPYISQSIKETIREECRQNLLIKEYIFPHLKGKKEELQLIHQR